MISANDLLSPTIRLDGTNTLHDWLNYDATKIGNYNAFDCLSTALAYRGLRQLLESSGNLGFYDNWFSETVPAARAIQARGFGHLDRGRLAAYKDKLGKDLGELEDKILSRVSLFQELRDAADYWRIENEAMDRAAALAKNAKKKRPLPEDEVKLTKELSREKGYHSRLAKAEKARQTFLNSRGENGKLAEWLFGEAGFKPAPKAHKRPARSTAQAALMYIYTHLRKKDQPNKWILEDLFHRSRLNTIRTRYLWFPTGTDDRVYPRLRLYTAETFRWAYSDPPLHQWPKEIRHLICARPGHVFVGADYSQLEARIMAYYAGEQKDIDAFEDPRRDIHVESALDVFDHPYTLNEETLAELGRRVAAGEKKTHAYAAISPAWGEMTKLAREQERDYSKKKRYEIGYGASEKGAAAQKLFCPCPRKECREGAPTELVLSPERNKRVAQRWAVTRPTTMKWREELIRSVTENGRRWKSPFGYTRQFCAPAAEMRTSLLNCPMQSSGAFIVNRCVSRLHRMGWPVVLQMHDQIVLEVPKDQANDAAAVLRSVMETPVPEIRNAIFPVDLKIGEDWGQL